MTLTTALLTLTAYLIGSVPFAVVVSKAFGLNDPRNYGSGNPGATNVLRSGNKAAAALTLIGDAAKGLIAVWVMRQFGSDAPSAVALAGIAAFIGHVFPVFLGFKGGKGVATAIGVLGAFSGWLALASAVTWLIIAVTTRYSSLAALIAAIAAPAFAHVLLNSPAITGACLIMAAMLLWRHTDNIKRLLAGTESRIGKKKRGDAG
ncbi:MAG TPA: glycerol-3-phosphate 1-O-acyltransferase PlsY [Denitromonas sp.]|uniref:glycerol-3-phosphate 1-O-acyltransferase PlsY n=1 Tax=Denitromonas sp. TaxID=2734609 RepID=UPI001E0D78BF|nr:glycerol-3-phosphate 1-O-acyltransferase PlsY [Rhodocyclaceae bacterium]MCP5221769.1 glycerol-3-phosphate 1-O-acyltransferase PlsY [Zoogloeaceae bacterium]HQU89157.1 glycerol-3-phosphate 1-O-acyltransferase PlsY [Denitromonas sp.]HQV15330.1 glycerol-3-phosphate 1-O-acyltransferase PlsY [Denitromonas sp.]